jgi:hypothetical protein
MGAQENSGHWRGGFGLLVSGIGIHPGDMEVGFLV